MNQVEQFVFDFYARLNERMYETQNMLWQRVGRADSAKEETADDFGALLAKLTESPAAEAERCLNEGGADGPAALLASASLPWRG